MAHQSISWAIFLDLDETLVFTSPIEPLRRKRLWEEAKRSFHRTSLPPGTQQFLQHARILAPLGIITMTPRPYAQGLATHHHLALPVVIAFHDTKRRKPAPDPILAAARLWQIAPSRCFYIGDTVDDITAAAEARALPIGLTWNGVLQTQSGAARALALCTNWEEVLSVIVQTMKRQEVLYGNVRSESDAVGEE